MTREGRSSLNQRVASALPRSVRDVRHSPHTDVMLVCLLAFSAVLCAWLAAPLAVRLPLGMLAALFAPGATLAAALFPQGRRVDGLEKFALGIALSIAAAAVYAPLCSRTPWGLSLPGVSVTLVAWCAIGAGVTVWRRRRASPALVESEPAVEPALWRDANVRIALLFGVACASVSALTVAVTLTTAPPSMTEFYVLEADAPPSGSDASPAMYVGIVNREHQRMVYALLIDVDGQEIIRLEPLALEAGETWAETLSMDGSAIRDRPIRLTLFKSGESTPHRQLRLARGAPALGLDE